MATTGIVNGTLMLMYVGNTAIGSCTSHALTVSMGTRDTTNKGSAGWKTALAGLRNWGASGSGFVTFDDTYGFPELFGLVTNRTLVTIRLSTEVTGDHFYQGSAHLTEVSMDAPLEDNTTYSFTFEGTGALSELSQT